jgi:hypothetical protein
VFGTTVTVLSMGFATLVVDAGTMYHQRVCLQRTADAAALGGAAKLPETTAANSKAQSVSTANGYQNGSGDVTVTTVRNPDGNHPWRYQVTVSKVVPTVFGKLLGHNGSTVSAHATAALTTGLDIAQPTNLVNNTFALMAGQNMPAGTVTISNDSHNLYFEYDTTGGWVMNATHLYVGTTPANKEAPGQFPYQVTGMGGATHYKYTVPLTWPSGTNLYIAGHADVTNGSSQQTAWADGGCLAFKKSWGQYLCYTTLSSNGSGVTGALAMIPAAAAGSNVYANKFQTGPVSSVSYADDHGNHWSGTAAPEGGWRMDVLPIPSNYAGGILGVTMTGDANPTSGWELYFEGKETGKDSKVHLVD